MKRWIIGDVRGELNLLKSLIDRLGPTESDLVLFLGSYLGPGADSKGVVDYIIELQNKLPGKILCLRGCYEYVFRYAIEENVDWSTAELWGRMRGDTVFKSYSPKDQSIVVLRASNNGKPAATKVDMQLVIPEPHIRFFDSLSQWYEDDVFPYIGCHSGGHPGLYGGKLENEEQTVFAENDWWKQEWRQIPGKTVVFSHVVFKKPFRKVGKIGIDLGAGFGGKLCSFEMMSEEFTTVGG